jgi:glycosyltransferase involved in cell wall biosynthesis
MTSGVELSVILPTRNGERFIEEQLEALSRQAWDARWEIVLLNNGSTDSTRELLEHWTRRMPVETTIVDADEYLSLAYARNAGVAAASGTSVAFCDDDDVVCDGWVGAIGEALRRSPFVASSFEYQRLNDPVTAAVRGSFQTDQLGVVMGVEVASGGGAGCHREAWERVGGNSLSFFHSGEDIDFSLRLTRELGISPVLVTAAVYHVRLRSGAGRAFTQGVRFARAAVSLYKLHGAALGAKPEPARHILRRWAGLVARLPGVVEKHRRSKWFWQLGYRLGRLRGSFTERVWYP